MLGSDRDMKLALSGSKMLGTILVNIDGITHGIGLGTYQVSLDGSFDGYNGGKCEGLFIGGSLGYTDNKLVGTDEVITLISDVGKELGIILEYVPGVTFGLDDKTELGSLSGSFNGSNDGKLEGLLLGDLLGYTDSKVVG